MTFNHLFKKEQPSNTRKPADQSHIPDAGVSSQTVQRALENPTTENLTPDVVQSLQSAHGNQFVNRLVSQGSGLQHPIQAKLTVTPAGDKYEQEADNVAKEVVQQMREQPVQRAGEEDELQMKRIQRAGEEDELQMERVQRAGEEDELQMKRIQREEEDELAMKRIQRAGEEDELQMKRIQRAEEDELQMKSLENGGDVTPDVESQIEQARGGGQSMDDSIRQPLEQAFGTDFSGVRIHTDSQSDTLNRSVQARAFTTGSDIFFRSGEYQPGSSGGQELLAHELTHVVQQGGGK